MAEETLFKQLNSIDVSDHVEKKGTGNYSLSYLSWVWAWNKIKEIDSNAKREYTKFDEYNFNTGQLTGRKVDYMLTEQGCYVECTVTIKGHSETESLYVMDFKNKAVKNPDMGQINKTKQRCFVKAAALQGLGLYIYAGEDLPASTEESNENISKPRIISSEDSNKLEDAVTKVADDTHIDRKLLVDKLFAYLNKEFKTNDIKSFNGITIECSDKVIDYLKFVSEQFEKRNKKATA